MDAKSQAGRELSRLMLAYIASRNADWSYGAAHSLRRVPGLVANIKDDLVKFWPSANPEVRNLIAWSLWLAGFQSQEVKQMLLAGLSDKDAHVQTNSLVMVVELKLSISDLKPHLLRMIKSTYPTVRFEAVAAMGDIGTYDAFARELRRIIDKDKDEEVVRRASKRWRIWSRRRKPVNQVSRPRFLVPTLRVVTLLFPLRGASAAAYKACYRRAQVPHRGAGDWRSHAERGNESERGLDGEDGDRDGSGIDPSTAGPAPKRRGIQRATTINSINVPVPFFPSSPFR